MIIKKDEMLCKHTTVKIGGMASEYLVPESVEELMDIVENRHPEYFIGGGSNILIPDKRYEFVVDLSEFNKSFECKGNGVFCVGASVRLQSLINGINEMGYGGIEYLYSVPGLVGGAIVMNAGRGRVYQQSISDYINSVEVLKDGSIITINKNECLFDYRTSIFKNEKMIVLSCVFCFPEMDKSETEKLKKERITLCREKQDNSAPNFGTVFSKCDSRIMKFVKKVKMGGKHTHFSGKTENWIINQKGGSYSEAVSAIKKAESIHKILGKKCEREVIVWE